MTPIEMQEAAKALRSEIGEGCYLGISLNDYGQPCHASVYPNGICGERAFSLSAESWEALFASATTKWAEFKETHKDRRVVDMALAIIKITAEQGECSDAALRGSTFSDSEVAEYGEEACARADSIASNGPFSITSIGKANAA